MQKKTINVLMIACKFEAGGAPRSMMDMILNLQKNHNVKVTLAVSVDEKLGEWCRNKRNETSRRCVKLRSDKSQAAASLCKAETRSRLMH